MNIKYTMLLIVISLPDHIADPYNSALYSHSSFNGMNFIWIFYFYF